MVWLMLCLLGCRSDDPPPPTAGDTGSATGLTGSPSNTAATAATADTADIVACEPAEPPPPTGPHLEDLRICATLHPPFSPGNRFYWARASELQGLGGVQVAPSEGAQAHWRVETVDGHLPSDPTLTDRRLRIDVGDGAATSTYAVALLSDTFPVPVTCGTPAAPGWTFLTLTNKEEVPYRPAAMVVDAHGTPGWWQEEERPSFDLRVTADGRISWVGRLPGTLDMRGFVRAADGSLAVQLGAGPVPDHWRSARVDEHEWEVLADGTARRILTYRVQEDLSPWGGPSVQSVEHQVAQHVDLEGSLLFQFSTEGLLPYDELPAELLARMNDTSWEPFHINSIDVDPTDGHWVLSLQRVSTVVKVARTGPRQGEVLWVLGGLSSDFRFLGDPRDGGWEGFAGQHSVRVTGPNRIELFDNANAAQGGVGDVRVLELQLDTDALTAETVWERVWTGRGQAYAGGSVQSLPGGGHLVGFGSLDRDAQGRAVPAVAELGVDDRVVWNLWLPEHMWSYRAWRFEGDPLQGAWVPRSAEGVAAEVPE